MMNLIDWLLIAAVLILGIGMFIGAVLYDQETADEHARLAERERQLQAEWDALEQAQRINDSFWQARTAMRNEVLRRHRGTPGNTGQTPR